jgi:Domain of unknown function (DUF4190)
MSTPPGALPPPTQTVLPTQVVGQQSAPSTTVPIGGTLQSSSIVMGGRPTNSLAIVSLVTAIVAPFGHLLGVGGITLIIVSIVTGHMARSQIKQTGEGGETFALVGLIISYVHLVATVLLVIFLFGVIVAFLTAILHSATTR